jgi:hypothetical protein
MIAHFFNFGSLIICNNIARVNVNFKHITSNYELFKVELMSQPEDIGPFSKRFYSIIF